MKFTEDVGVVEEVRENGVEVKLVGGVGVGGGGIGTADERRDGNLGDWLAS